MRVGTRVGGGDAVRVGFGGGLAVKMGGCRKLAEGFAPHK